MACVTDEITRRRVVNNKLQESTLDQIFTSDPDVVKQITLGPPLRGSDHLTAMIEVKLYDSSYINVPSDPNLPYSPVQNPCHISVILVPVINSVYFCHFSPQKTKKHISHHHRNKQKNNLLNILHVIFCIFSVIFHP